MQACNDYVFIKEAEDLVKTDSGLVLTGSAVDKPTHGVVVSAGPGHYNENGTFVECPLKTGDKVIYGRPSEQDRHMINGHKLLVLKYFQIYGKL